LRAIQLKNGNTMTVAKTLEQSLTKK